MKRTLEILRAKTIKQHSQEEILEAICVDLAEAIKADRVSIWFFNKAQTAIECQIYYDADDKSFKSGQVIKRSECPRYFQTIIEETCIAVTDSRNQFATRELAESYLIPNDIQSTLDFILHQAFIPVGVICCETRHAPRNWTEADKSKLRIVAELLSHRFEFNLKDTA